MNHIRTLAIALTSLSAAFALHAADAPKKPAPKKPLAPLAPVKTMKDLAIEEAQKFDKDHNGKLESIEVMALNAEMKTNANSHLYIFDENSNHVLDEMEIKKIPLKQPDGKPAATPKPADAHKPDDPHKPAPTNHPHGAPHH